jgi:hypothetical protein
MQKKRNKNIKVGKPIHDLIPSFVQKLFFLWDFGGVS